MNPSVVIVAYNSADVLERCWRSVRHHLPGTEIIVVDNASTDRTAQLCRELAGVRLITNPINTGYGRACNQGVESARARNVMVLNPDIELSEVDHDLLAAEARKAPFGLIAPMLQHGRHASQPWTVDLIRHVLGPLRPRELPVLPKPVIRRRSWWPAGALLLIDRVEFGRIGGFDPRFFLYYEDLDLARRYRAAGLPVRVTRAVRATHGRGTSSAGAGAGSPVRLGWSYLSWIEYICTWNGRDTAIRAASSSRRLRAGVDRALAVVERASPASCRAALKRHELAELEQFIQWQSTFAEGTADKSFCPRARDILAAL